MLFFNERGELTEGAISNLFIQKGGYLFTPALSCGLLPGVYRQHLLATCDTAREAVLLERDLVSADAIYLCSALRGLRRVEAVVAAPGANEDGEHRLQPAAQTNQSVEAGRRDL